MEAEIYTWTSCPFCVRAKRILAERGIPFIEHVMDGKAAELAAVKRQHAHPTVPIILLDGEFIGGCDDLEELVRTGRV